MKYIVTGKIDADISQTAIAMQNAGFDPNHIIPVRVNMISTAARQYSEEALVLICANLHKQNNQEFDNIMEQLNDQNYAASLGFFSIYDITERQEMDDLMDELEQTAYVANNLSYIISILAAHDAIETDDEKRVLINFDFSDDENEENEEDKENIYALTIEQAAYAAAYLPDTFMAIMWQWMSLVEISAPGENKNRNGCQNTSYSSRNGSYSGLGVFTGIGTLDILQDSGGTWDRSNKPFTYGKNY